MGLAPYRSSQLILTASKPEGQPHPLMCKQQFNLDYNRRRTHTAHTRNIPGTSGSVYQGDDATGLHRTPTTQGYYAKMRRSSRSMPYIETNPEGQPK